MSDFEFEDQFDPDRLHWVQDTLARSRRNLRVVEHFQEDERLDYEVVSPQRLREALNHPDRRAVLISDLQAISRLVEDNLNNPEVKANCLLDEGRDAYLTPVELTKVLGVHGFIFTQEGRRAPECNTILLLRRLDRPVAQPTVDDLQALYGYIDRDHNIVFQRPKFDLQNPENCPPEIAELIRTTMLCALHDRLVRVGQTPLYEPPLDVGVERERTAISGHKVKMCQRRRRTPYALSNAGNDLAAGKLDPDVFEKILSSVHITYNKGDSYERPSIVDRRGLDAVRDWVEKKGGMVNVLQIYLNSF